INSTGKVELGPPNAGILFPPWKLESLSFLQKATSKPHLGWNSGLIATIPSIFYKIFDGTLKFQKFEPLHNKNEFATKYRILTDTIDPKNEFLNHGDIKSYFTQSTNTSKLRAFSFDYVQNSDLNPNSIISAFSSIDKLIKKCDEKVFSAQIGWWLWYFKGYLDGMLEDWLHLQEKVLKLRDLGLELDFGDVDENFWSIAVSQVPYVSFIEFRWDGWISALFPYNSSKCKLTDNSIFPTHIPSGLLNVSFELDMGKHFRLSIVAGFFGVRQEKIDEEYVVSPVIC
ncbi:11901_t:CDS:2, partial [Funneliformis mosseae]